MVAGGLQPATKAYISALVCLAIGLALATLAWAARPTGREAALATTFAGCMTLAWLFPLHFASKTKLYVDTAVTVAVVLLFEPAVTMLIAGGGTFLAHGLRPASRDWTQAAFNAAQAALLGATGALLLAAVGWDPARPTFGHPWSLAVLPAAAVLMHVLSVLAIATVVAFEAKLPVVESWRRAFLEDPRVEALSQVSLVGIGVVAAIVADAHPWGLALLVAPVVAVYGTLRHQGQVRQELERARLASEVSLAHAQRVAHLGSWTWDLATDEILWSDEALRILGFSPHAGQPAYQSFLAAVDPADRDRVRRAIRGAIDNQAPLRIDYRIRLPDGANRPLHQEVEIYRDADGRAIGLDGTIQDVTERKTLEARIADVTERQRIMRELAETRRGLAASREDERLHLARALHDGPVQDLLAISYQLAAQQPSAGHAPSGTYAAPVVELARQELLDVVGQLRGMVGELRPAGLAEFGLSTAIEGYVAGLQRRADRRLPAIIVDIDDGIDDLAPSLAITVFRIVQEALRNALRHAEADDVVITFGAGEGTIVLRIRDNGRGFTVPSRLGAFADAGHFGIVGITERVDQADGELMIESAPGAGTTICVQLPWVPAGCRDD